MTVRYGAMGEVRRWLISSIGLMFLVQSLSVSAQASEAGLRVAFIYNFLKFIEWPNQKGDELLVCAVGAQGTTRESLEHINKKSLQKLAIKVLFFDEAAILAEQITQCHLVYVPTSGADFSLPAEIPAGVLLVADEPDLQDARIGIALTRTRENRIEFAINEPAIKRAGVKVSSQLLKLARKQPGGAS